MAENITIKYARSVVFRSTYFFLMLLALLTLNAQCYADGIDWLMEQQQNNGEFVSSSDIATPYQATAEVLRLHALTGQLTALASDNAYAFIEDNPLNNTESSALLIQLRKQSDQAVGESIEQLLTYQHSSGGFGEFVEFQSTLLDSAFALKALAVDKSDNLTAASQTVTYILARQNSDGSFNDNTDPSGFYITALIIDALWEYRHDLTDISTAIENAKNWLLEQKNSDSLWGESFISAQILMALLPTENDNSRLQDSLDALSAEQLFNGSWQDDVFATAKALTALYIAEQSKPDHAGLSGRIQDAETQSALSNVSVSLTIDGVTATQITDQQGNFNFTSLVSGHYQLRFDFEGYNALETVTDLAHGQHLDMGNINLLRDINDTPDYGIIQGNIYDTSGNPLADVQLALNGVEGSTTDADGFFQVLNIKPGEMSLTASKDGYQAQQTTINLSANQTLLYSIQLNTVSIQSSNLTGIVVDKQTQQAIANVVVNLSGANIQDVQTAEDGSYSFTGLDSGITSVNVVHAGYHAETASIDVQLGTHYRYSPQLVDSSNIPEVTPGTLTGLVVDAASQLALADVSVQLSNGQVQQSDFNGHFHFTGLNSAELDLTLSLNNYQSQTYHISVSDGVVVDLGTLELLPQSNEYQLTARVVDSTTNLPLENAQVVVSNSDNQQLTLFSNQQGEINVTQLSQPFNQLQVSVADYQAVTFDTLLTPIVLNDLGQIRLRPVDVETVLPDLVITDIDKSLVSTNSDNLTVSGTLAVNILNQGNSISESSITILAYYDQNKNGQYEIEYDGKLGSTQLDTSLPANAETSVQLELDGLLPYRDAPILLYLDSEQTLVEQDEENNQLSTAQSCKAEPLDTSSAFNPKLKWYWSGSAHNPAYDQVMQTPVVGQLNDDNNDGVINQQDIPDVVFSTHSSRNDYYKNGILRAISGADGSEIWQPDTDRFGFSFYSPALADIDGDGVVEIITSKDGFTNYHALAVYEHDGTLKWEVPGALSGNIAVADLDGDGVPEILSSGTVFNNQGQLLFDIGDDPTIMAVDLDLDGDMEIFAHGTAYDHTGQELWTSGRQTHRYGSFAAVGNFDEDDYPEIAFTDAYSLHNVKVVVLEHTGEVKWISSIPGGGGGALTVADFDGDGQPEIGTAGAKRYAVFETDGSLKWQQNTQDASSKITGSSVFDFDGDGKAEVVYADEQFLRVYNGEDGTVILAEPNTSGTMLEYPLIVDIDNDGHSEILVISNDIFSSHTTLPDGTQVPGTHGIRVFENEQDDWMPTRPIWNQYNYYINNINDDGTVPQWEQPSWLSHNTYRLNTFIGRDVLAQTDLTAAQLTTASDGQGLNLSVLVGNAGLTENSAAQVSFYQDSSQGILLGSIDLPILAPGEYQTLHLSGIADISYGSNVVAVIDPQGQLNECDTLNNQVTTTAQAINGQVSLQLDSNQLADNDDLIINASINNTGIYTSDYQVQWLIESTQGALLEQLPEDSITALASGDSVSLDGQWNSGNHLSGDYQVHVVLTDSNGQSLHETTQGFTIVASTTTNPMLDSAIISDKATYSAWDTVALTARLQNLANNAGLAATVVELTVINPSQSTLLFDTQDIAALTPQQMREFNFSLALSDATAGDYQANWRVLDAQSGTLLSEKTLTFTVERHALQGLQGQVSASVPQLEAGQPLTCSEQLNNLSQSAVNGLTVKHQVFNMADDTLINETSRIIDLAGQGQHLLERDVPTQSLAAGDYACVLYVEHDGQTSTLDYAAFQVTVTSTPIELTTELNHTPEKGRMLLLMHPSTKDTSHCWGQGHYTFTASLSGLNLDETLTLHLDDHSNQRVDSEVLQFNREFYPYNLNPSSHGADLIVEQLNNHALQLSLVTDNRRHGDWLSGYSMSLQNSAGDTLLQSDAFPVNCAQPVNAGETWGDFTLSAIPYNDLHWDDSLPPSWVNPVADRLYWESQLYQNGWAVDIVTQPDSFEQAMHTGHYNAYALSSRRGQLSATQQKLLREAVYRGESLLVMECSQAFCQDGLGQALGIDFANGKNVVKSIHLLSSPLYDAPLSLDLQDNLAKGTLNGATLAAESSSQKSRKGNGNASNNAGNNNSNGNINNADNTSSGEPIALSYYDYGNGRAIYIGFDLIEQALNSEQPAFNTIMGNSLQYLKSQQSAGSYQLIPITLQWQNQGLPVTGEVRFTLPEDTELVTASQTLQSETDDNGDTHYRFPLDTYRYPQNELTLWLIVTNSQPWTLSVEWWLEQNGVLNHYQTRELNLPLDDAFDFIQAADWGQACPACDTTLQMGLLMAQQYYIDRDIHQAIRELLGLTDDLIDRDGAILTQPPNPVRLELGQGLRQLGRER